MTIIVTGAAGFIGSHVAHVLLDRGDRVVGLDNINDYYSVKLKQDRLARLTDRDGFTFHQVDLADFEALKAVVAQCGPIRGIIHLAAQAGVRYSLENPRAYVESNIVGTFNVMEAARRHKVRHLLMASTSSIYGANTDMPFDECEKADTQLTMYAATKKANESMGHSYAHLWDLPTTMFRFFTVYGPWGRPDMAYFKFTRAILKGEAIEVYNHGRMRRDFTYIDDLTAAITALIEAVPGGEPVSTRDSLSPVAPFRLVNIGAGSPVGLMEFIGAIESALGEKAVMEMKGMQPGDVPATWADTSLLKQLAGDRPITPLAEGIQSFVDWYRSYYGA